MFQVKDYPSTTKCDLCENALRQFDTFYDGNTVYKRWAWICKECWQYYGMGIGTGLGQEFDSKTGKKLRG